MLTKSSVFLGVFALATIAMGSPLTKRSWPTVIITPTPETKIVPVENYSTVDLEGRASSFIFNYSIPYLATATQFFYWDIYREDTGLQEQLYHLTCSVRITSDFGMTAEYEIHNKTEAPHVVLIGSGATPNDYQVRISCEAKEGSCSSQDKQVCDAMPQWVDENGLN